MEFILPLLQVIIALGIYNVWLLRFGKATSWRAGGAGNMKEEFAYYGLPGWFVWVAGTLKLVFATLLLAALWVPALLQPAAYGMAALMLGAVVMHVKVQDPAKKFLPSATLFGCCLIVALA